MTVVASDAVKSRFSLRRTPFLYTAILFIAYPSVIVNKVWLAVAVNLITL